MIFPQEKDIGRKVVYLATGEVGYISSFDEYWVYVQFQGGIQRTKCHRPELEWEIVTNHPGLSA